MNSINNQMPPKSWLVESILATILCCLPFGVVGIIYASKVESLFNSGNVEAAEQASKQAKTWFIVSLIAGIFSVIIGFILLFVVGLASEL